MKITEKMMGASRSSPEAIADAERTSLLSLGDDECRFAVLETDDPLDGYADVLARRFADPGA